MMTNQELLTLAAKAAGYQVSTNGTDFWLMKDGVEIQHWNPLQQDDHALRLAVQLNLVVECMVGQSAARTFDNLYAGCCDFPEKIHDGCERDFAPDAFAATRRAIVLAAAEIGKMVQEKAIVRIYDQLLGLTFLSVEKESCEELVFKSNDGREFTFTHVQDCCEDVRIEDICGDLQDLVGSPLLEAEEVTYSDVNPAGVPSKDYQDSFTWTFYKFATIKGSVTVRWYGASNGYYSESVDLHQSEVAK